jgi:hypothetical protein
MGLVGDEGNGVVVLLLDVAGEGVGDGVLLVVVGEGGDELLVVWAKVSAACSSSTLSSTQASLLLFDHTSECITKYELEILY